MRQGTEESIKDGAGRPRRWWRRPWMAPLAVVIVAFLAFSVPPYLTFDPGQVRLPLRESLASPHYALLVGHILFGTVALMTCCLQVWPWLRQRNPGLHRRLGRIYVFAGVLPASLLAGTTAVVSLTDVPGRIGNLMLAVLWLVTAIAGYRTARQRRYADHRRWMVRSFALTTSIVVNRLWIVLLFVVLTPFLDSHYAGDFEALTSDVAVASIWLSWVVNLIIAEWWLDRRRGATRRAPRDTARGTVVGPGADPAAGAAVSPAPSAPAAC